jgi:hypothetical protein
MDKNTKKNSSRDFEDEKSRKEIKSRESSSSSDNESSEDRDFDCSNKKYKDCDNTENGCCCVAQGEAKCCCNEEKESEEGDCCCIKNGSMMCCCEHEKSLLGSKSYINKEKSSIKSNIENESVSRLIETPITSRKELQNKDEIENSSIKNDGNKTYNHHEKSKIIENDSNQNKTAILGAACALTQDKYDSNQNKAAILGAACALTQDKYDESIKVTNDLIEEIQEVKKNIKSSGTYDVFIVNEEGKVNSYEINHYLNEVEEVIPRDVQINQQLYGSSIQNKTISDKQNKYQKKLISILNEIKQKSQNEPLKKESTPTILEISQFTVVNNNTGKSEDTVKPKNKTVGNLLFDEALIECYCGNGLEAEICRCSDTKLEKEEHESNIYLSSGSSDEHMFESSSALSDHTYQSDDELSELENIEEVRSLYDYGSEEDVNSKDNMRQQVYVEFERIQDQSSRRRSTNESGKEKVYASLTELEDYSLQGDHNAYGLSAEYEKIMKNDEKNQSERNSLNNKEEISDSSMGTQSLAEVLDVNVADINGENFNKENNQQNENSLKTDISSEIVQELIERNDKIIKEEHTSTPVASIHESKSAPLSQIILSKSNHSLKEKDQKPVIDQLDAENTLNKTETYHEASGESTEKELGGLEDNQNQELENIVTDDYLTEENLNNLVSLKVPEPEIIAPFINDSEIQDSETSNDNLLPEQSFYNHPPTPNYTIKSSEIQSIHETEVNGSINKSPEVNSKVESSIHENTESSIHETTELSIHETTSIDDGATSYVEIEIHLSNHQSEIEKSADISNSMITFVENDIDNYSQTLQNIRKNKVGKLVKFYEELDKKNKF